MKHCQPHWLPETFIVYPLALKKTLMCERRELLALPPACWIAKSSAGAKGEECFVDDDVNALLQRVDCSGTISPFPAVYFCNILRRHQHRMGRAALHS